MKLYIRGRDVTGLASAVTTSGALAECARTLTAEIVQSPEGRGVPSVDLSEASPSRACCSPPPAPPPPGR